MENLELRYKKCNKLMIRFYEKFHLELEVLLLFSEEIDKLFCDTHFEKYSKLLKSFKMKSIDLPFYMTMTYLGELKFSIEINFDKEENFDDITYIYSNNSEITKTIKCMDPFDIQKELFKIIWSEVFNYGDINLDKDYLYYDPEVYESHFGYLV